MCQIKKWYDMELNPGKIAINIAGKQLESTSLAAIILFKVYEKVAVSLSGLRWKLLNGLL